MCDNHKNYNNDYGDYKKMVFHQLYIKKENIDHLYRFNVR
jgi:hypothetical protein